MVIGGIDPGLKGGIGFIDLEAQTLCVYRMPVFKRALATTTKTEVDGLTLAEILRRHKPDEIWVEDVFAFGGKRGSNQRQDGVVGAFSFGHGKGVLAGTIAGALGLRPRYVPAASWKGTLRVPSDKVASVARAQHLLQGCAHLLTNDGLAEGALIALYGAIQGGARVGRLLQSPCQPSGRRSARRAS